MTSFTDERLKRLKEEADRNSLEYPIELSATEIKALLARLEAAERVVHRLDKLSGAELETELNYLLDGWQKTCGK